MAFRQPRRSLLTVIHQSEVGYRELLGANRTRLQPGLRWNLPILHELHRVDMRETGMPVSRLNCYTEDNVPVSVSGTLFMRVVDPEKACFEVVDYRSAMFDVGQSTVRAVVGRFQFDEIIRDRNAVNQQLRAILGSSTDKWGVVCTRFELEDFGPQNRGVSETMERQMNAERHRREKELNTQADIRTAEGDKLARNHASDAAFYQAQKTADAAKYAADQATAAQTTRVAQIRAALPALSDQQVAAMVLEERRLAHLAAIAEHPDGKNTYFIDPNGSFPAVQTLLSAARTAE